MNDSLRWSAMTYTLLVVLGVASVATAAPPTVVTYWHAYSGRLGQLHESLVTEFNDTHPDIRVEAVYGGNLWTLRDKLTAAIGVDAGPDVASIDQFWIAPLASANAAVPLDAFPDLAAKLAAETAFREHLETGTYEGRLWSAPFAVSTVVMYGNLTLLGELGIDPQEIPATWQEMLALAADLPRDRDGDGRQDLWILDAPTTAQTGIVYYYIITLWQHGGEVLSPAGDAVAFDSPEGVASLHLWQQLVSEGVLELVRPQGVWESGRALFQIASSARITATYGDLPFAFTVAPLPYARFKINGLGGRNLALLTEEPETQSATLTFIRWMTSEEVGRRWSTSTGYAPLQRGIFASAQYQELLEADPRLETALHEMIYARARPNVPAYADVSRVLGEAVERALHSGGDAEAILAGAADEASRIVDSYRRSAP